MRLTHFSDYALRLMMYAAARKDELITIEETAELYGLSRAHLMKVANQLTRAGFLKATRGRNGSRSVGREFFGRSSLQSRQEEMISRFRQEYRGHFHLNLRTRGRRTNLRNSEFFYKRAVKLLHLGVERGERHLHHVGIGPMVMAVGDLGHDDDERPE